MRSARSDVSVVALDPRTGQVLAECSRRRGTSAQTDDAVSWAFGPGSSFKPFVVAAALENGDVNQKTVFDCGNGMGMFSGQKIKDLTPSGMLTTTDIIQKSSNVGMGRIGAKLSPGTFDYYIASFGFGSKTGINRSIESPGVVYSSASARGITKVRMSIGQSVEVTPIQLAMAYSAIANGGTLLKPKYQWNAPTVTVRRVISEKTACTLRMMLTRVVNRNGTAPLAAVNGVRVAGKTGTAQVVLPSGHYAADQYVSLFAGFYPVENPRVVCVVAVDQASVAPECNYGGLIAAPIFSRICSEAVKSGF